MLKALKKAFKVTPKRIVGATTVRPNVNLLLYKDHGEYKLTNLNDVLSSNTTPHKIGKDALERPRSVSGRYHFWASPGPRVNFSLPKELRKEREGLYLAYGDDINRWVVLDDNDSSFSLILNNVPTPEMLRLFSEDDVGTVKRYLSQIERGERGKGKSVAHTPREANALSFFMQHNNDLRIDPGRLNNPGEFEAALSTALVSEPHF